MKLRNIYVLCKDNYGDIENFGASDITINNRKGVRVKGWSVTLNAAMKLMEIEVFKKESSKMIEGVPVFYRTRDTFDIFAEEWGALNNARRELLKKIDTVMELYESTGRKAEEKMGLDIKMPVYNDFSDFAKYINDLEYIFTKCPFIQSDEEKLQFDSVDIGSTWLTFVVTGVIGGSILLNNVAAFVDKTIVVKSHYLTMKEQEQHLEHMVNTQEKKDAILEFLHYEYEKEVECAIEELERLTGHKVADADERDRIEMAFDRLGKLIDKGLQIYATIDSPTETKLLFEPLEMKYLEIEKKIELLEDNSESEEE